MSKIDDNDDELQLKIFKAFYYKYFDVGLYKYYNLLIKNDINNVDILLMIEKEFLLKQNIINNIHIELFMNKINEIKPERQEFVQFLKELDAYFNCGNKFSINGIFTRHDFTENINNVDELNDILNNPDMSTLIFERFNEMYNINGNNNSNNNSDDDNELMNILMNNNNIEGINNETKTASGIKNNDNINVDNLINTASNEYNDTIVSIEHDINNKNNDSINHLIITDDDDNETFQ